MSALPSLSTGMVPSPCVEQHTALTALAFTSFRFVNRRAAVMNAFHHSSGDCSVPPSGVI